MSGKAYTMKEMKSIVEYLTEHKAFAEIKGRKMWMDFANSKLTNRTWQSLKETFLKRILPDIHNPYYKLSVDQIRCFKEGCDVMAREKNKLEVFEVDDNSNTNADMGTENANPSSSHDKNGEATSGEGIKSEKVPSHGRASIDTVIIANCYETDDDLRRVLESESSPKTDRNEIATNTAPCKSLRDLITYSEPLTPMLQEVLNDFASENESDGELRMQIVENDNASNPVNPNEDNVIEIFDSDDVLDRNNDADNIVEKNPSIVENLNQDVPAEEAVGNGEDANTKKKFLGKERVEAESNLKEVAATEEKSYIEQDAEKNESTDDILESQRSSLTTDTVLILNDKTERNKDKNETKENSPDKENSVEKRTSNDSENAEDFVQPKVLLKLRKRKVAADKIADKKPKKVKTRAEMYEIVEPVILEKSGSSVSEVDKLSNYANNKDDIVSSTVPDKTTQNSSTSDTILPNNQEALNNSEKRAITGDPMPTDISKSLDIPKKVAKPKTTRKRAISQDVASTSGVSKNKLNVLKNPKGKVKAVSDTDDIAMKKLIKAKLTQSKLDLKKTNVIDVKDKNVVADLVPSKENAVDNPEDVPTTSQPIIDSSQASELNPCLKSVSLYAEQFNTISLGYFDSESEHETTPAASASDRAKNKPSTSKANKETTSTMTAATSDSKNKDVSSKIKTLTKNLGEIVMLKSHSESESDTNNSPPKQKQPANQEIAKTQRDKAVANIFGFNSGGLKRKKRLSHRKNSAYHQRREETSYESSEWTSESDSEPYVSPPRGRRNKRARKYLKPHSARIHSLEDEGGLFVMYGKKIYPLVKDGRMIKNYLTYLPESDPEEEENYWKLKYVEERKRVAELTKIMKENEEEITRAKSPILPARPLCSLSTFNHQGSPFKNPPIHDNSKGVPVEPEKESKKRENDTGKTLKITFAKNNQEVHMEGHWSQIHPVLTEVVQIFNIDAEATATRSSGSLAVLPSPVDPDILEKVNRLETEIFKEIEEREQEEVIEGEPKETKEQPESNVTKRKRASRVRKSTSTVRSSVQSSPSSTRSPKRQKTSPGEPKDELAVDKTPKTRGKKDKTESNNSKEKEAVDAVDSTTSVASKKQARTLKIDTKEPVNTLEVNVRSSRRSKPATKDSKLNTSQVEDDPDIRYMFPPTARARKSSQNISKSKEKSKRYMAPPPQTSSQLSMHDESTQGYQDSDITPPKASLRRKRKLSLSTVLYRSKIKNNRPKRKSFPTISDDASSDNSTFQIIVRPNNSRLKSAPYKSDSYQLLFPQNKSAFKHLEKIDEDTPYDSLHPNKDILDNRGRILQVRLNRISNEFLTSSNTNTDGNSSNVSLPMSPELSIVENMSISKELVNSVEDYPTINEIQANDMTDRVIHNKYLISQVDVTMPLMQQECGLHESISKKVKPKPNDIKMSVVFNSLVNKNETVSMEEAPSLSDSLDARLKNLLLESAKKMSMSTVQEEAPNVNIIVNKNEAQKKGKSKRCSTPRKKKNLKKSKLPAVDPVVEEEFTESCSYGGRKSCPPAIHVIGAEDVPKENSITVKDTVPEKSKGRRKKDIIKVKILRPRNKSKSPEVTQNTSKTTEHTDSGINESGLTVQGMNESVDLIHNHSETCLLANECMGNSIEFVEPNTESIISLNSDSATSPDRIYQDKFIFQDCRDFDPNQFCENAQSFCQVDCVPESVKQIIDTSDTVYHSPVVSEVSINSLITEDLSDETPQSSQLTKWYLFSEDDTSTNPTSHITTVPSSFGANLKQIFPITCAVPDLSTITEMSNENSRKPTLESANSTRHDLDSQSMFNNSN